MMTLWKERRGFTPEFLIEHHDLVLYDALHHIKALLLYPPNCSCEKPCQCAEWREKIVLALNTYHYNKAYKENERSERVRAMRNLWDIPDNQFFREQYVEAYPLWVIEKELRRRKETFWFIDQLVWAFLRLGKTMEYLGRAEVSINEAVKVLQELFKNAEGDEFKGRRPWGKKKCAKEFKRYESVCHFIAALKIWEGEVQNKGKTFTSLDPSLAEIERILKVSHWFRKKLLSLKRRNVTDNIFLLEENISPLPLWVQSEEIDFSIERYEEKIKEILNKAILVNPQEKFLMRMSRNKN